jgi:hypothetical protein
VWTKHLANWLTKSLGNLSKMLWRKTLSKINAADRKHAAQIEFAASYRVQTCEVGLVNLISAPAIFIKIALETPFLSEFFTRVLVEPRLVVFVLVAGAILVRPS